MKHGYNKNHCFSLLENYLKVYKNDLYNVILESDDFKKYVKKKKIKDNLQYKKDCEFLNKEFKKC